MASIGASLPDMDRRCVPVGSAQRGVDSVKPCRQCTDLLITSYPQLAVRPASALKTLANVLDPSCTARFVYGEKVLPFTVSSLISN